MSVMRSCEFQVVSRLKAHQIDDLREVVIPNEVKDLFVLQAVAHRKR